jgi:hypothetical protein
MKYLIALLMFVSSSAFAQTNLRTVMTDTNGVVQRPTNFITTNRIVSVATNGTVANPTNFWTANSNSINSIVAASSNVNDNIFNKTTATFADLLVDSVNGTATVSNSIITTTISGTNASGKAAVCLIRDVNSRGAAGVGTLFANDSHTIWTRIDSTPRHGTVRVVLGNSIFSATNVSEYPTNCAIGFELSDAGGDTNQVRLIAHNGTTNTNGPWVNIGDVFQRYWIGVEQNKTNGEVKLYVGVNSAIPTNNTNATISGGPTNNAGAGLSRFDVGVFTTNTNAQGSFFNVYSAFVDVVD